MKKLYYINSTLVLILFAMCLAGFLEEAFFYVAVYMGLAIMCLQTLVVLILTQMEGSKWYLVINLLIVLAAVLISGKSSCYFSALSILYVSGLLYFKNENLKLRNPKF